MLVTVRGGGSPLLMPSTAVCARELATVLKSRTRWVGVGFGAVHISCTIYPSTVGWYVAQCIKASCSLIAALKVLYNVKWSPGPLAMCDMPLDH